ncbi:MAG: hypothetical protein J7K29_04365, partial [Candidatus Cloacimonetes bacterium]|nr:hypothetical protein [Candidatus Cloacimonadota bacterium]
MKRLSVFFFTLFIMVIFFGTDRWGTSSSYSSGTVIGTSRSVGIDPNGGLIYLYDSALLKSPEQGTRIGITLGTVENGEYLFDLAQCENDFFPQKGNAMVIMFSKRAVGSDGATHGYYGAVTMVKDDFYHEDPNNPEYVNDIVIYEIPIPYVETDRKNNYVHWDQPTIQPVGNQAGNPFIGYNLYYSISTKELATKINGAPIGWGEPGQAISYTDSLRDGYYFLTLVTKSGIELANWYVGPDKRPGKAGYDDNGNGKVDEEAELGFYDDVYLPVYSAPSNHVTDTLEEPVKVNDLSIVNSNNKIYLQWSSVGSNVSKYNIYKSIDGDKYNFLGNTQDTIYVDTGLKSTPYYYVTSVTDDYNESIRSNVVQADPFDGMADYGNFEARDTVLFPAWSKNKPPFLETQGIAYVKTVNSKGQLMLADLGNHTWVLNDALPVYWASTISWGDYHGNGQDSYIYFTVIDNNDHTQIFVQSANPTERNKFDQLSQGWGNWTDPDWTDSLNQQLKTNMLACSIDGDIYVFDPDNTDFEHGNLLALTDFFDPSHNVYGETDMCFQPKWSPDNTALAFIVRHQGNRSSVVASDIYIVPDVQNLIKDGDSGNPIKSLNDIRLEKATATHAPDRFLPIWAPSWSNDSTMLSYAVDVSNKFVSYDFSCDYVKAAEVLASTNFDAYTYERGIGTWTLGMPEMNTSDSEGFISWAPVGGDRFFYTKIDFSGKNVTIEQFIDPTIYGENSKSATAKKFETATDITISDRDYTSIEMAKDTFAKAGTIGIYP